MKRLSVLLVILVTAVAWAQNPDVTVKFDGRLDYRIPNGGASTQRLYDTLGRPSLLELSFRLEPGLRAFVSQRLQRIAHDGDNGLLDEYYIEDEGVWRVGKQFVPFGSGAFLRESVLSARGDIDLPIEGASLSIALADAGSGRQRGVVGRLSLFDGMIGLSAAVGQHWGISGSSFTLFRRPEASPGVGAGFERVFGVDISRTFGKFNGRAEFVLMGGGSSFRDPEGEALDVSGGISPSSNRSYTVGWTLSPDHANFYRLAATLEIEKNVFLEPMVRLRNGAGYDFSLQLHLHF